MYMAVARIAMIAMTTSNSISVNPALRRAGASFVVRLVGAAAEFHEISM